MRPGRDAVDALGDEAERVAVVRPRLEPQDHLAGIVVVNVAAAVGDVVLAVLHAVHAAHGVAVEAEDVACAVDEHLAARHPVERRPAEAREVEAPDQVAACIVAGVAGAADVAAGSGHHVHPVVPDVHGVLRVVAVAGLAGHHVLPAAARVDRVRPHPAPHAARGARVEIAARLVDVDVLAVAAGRRPVDDLARSGTRRRRWRRGSA